MPDLRQATDIEAKWIEAKRELDRLEAIFAKVDKVNVLKPWYGQEEKARYFELVDAIKKQKAIIESLNKGIDPSAPTGADAELDALKTPPPGGGAIEEKEWTPELESELTDYITDIYGKKYVKGMLEAAKTALDAPYSAIQLYATNNQINPQETSNVKAIYEDFWVGVDESGNPIKHEWGESVEGLTPSEQLAIDKFNEEKRQNELYWADKNTSAESARTDKANQNELDWRNYWDSQASETSATRRSAISDYQNLLTTNQQLELQRQQNIANLTPSQWMNKTDIMGVSPNLDWLELLGVSDAERANMYAQAQEWQDQQAQIRAQQAADLAEYYKAMADYTVAAAKREEYEKKVGSQASWTKDWVGTPNASALPEIMENYLGPEVAEPTVPYLNNRAPAATVANPWASIIRNTNIQHAGPETWYNQFSGDQRGMYSGLLSAKGYDPETAMAQDWAGVHYGNIKRNRNVY